MVTILSESKVEQVLDIEALLPVVEDALVQQTAGNVERPERIHFPVGSGLEGDEPLGTGIAMPAYIHGDSQFVTKLVTVNEGNETRGLPTLHAQILLTDARTGVTKALMGGTTVTNARTGCIGALAVRALAENATTLGVLGAGAQGFWQTRAINTVASLEDVRIHSPSDSRDRCAARLRDEGIPAHAVDSARRAVDGADVVVTATTSLEPVFPADALADGALVVAIGAYEAGMQELEPEVLEQADCVFADVPTEVAEIGDLLATDLSEDDLVPLGNLLASGYTRASPSETLVVESVGTASLDAAAAQAVYERAEEAGTEVPMD
ncbi:ornithine cyclodeaminase family protein [Natrinema halophilum]|uniref:Ornithine cyclodeaminase family protein n=1 Tax=Natrinema halophilum TaxID=1699371 RepID=A0A7D5KTM4_9EURY|nr:ornithine cyclodeaminase family protein [Natrinema halophilum]QLG50684.1 ornithine cyclodeaminase family protein [Natrinema halophilum]